MPRFTTESASRHEKLRSSEVLFLVVRVTVAAVWLYEGLWLKVLLRAPHELAVVESLPHVLPLSPTDLLTLIGFGETLLAVGVLSGLFWRPLALLQAALVVLMNTGGIVFAGGTAIGDPLGLVVHNLPFLACIALIGAYGPGPRIITQSNSRK